jgi:hypothetical protein
MNNTKEQREQFVRIAMARLKKTYPFRPQRLAIASKMYANWRQRKIDELLIKNQIK